MMATTGLLAKMRARPSTAPPLRLPMPLVNACFHLLCAYLPWRSVDAIAPGFGCAATKPFPARTGSPAHAHSLVAASGPRRASIEVAFDLGGVFDAQEVDGDAPLPVHTRTETSVAPSAFAHSSHAASGRSQAIGPAVHMKASIEPPAHAHSSNAASGQGESGEELAERATLLRLVRRLRDENDEQANRLVVLETEADEMYAHIQTIEAERDHLVRFCNQRTHDMTTLKRRHVRRKFEFDRERQELVEELHWWKRQADAMELKATELARQVELERSAVSNLQETLSAVELRSTPVCGARPSVWESDWESESPVGSTNGSSVGGSPGSGKSVAWAAAVVVDPHDDPSNSVGGACESLVSLISDTSCDGRTATPTLLPKHHRRKCPRVCPDPAQAGADTSGVAPRAQ